MKTADFQDVVKCLTELRDAIRAFNAARDKYRDYSARKATKAQAKVLMKLQSEIEEAES